MHTAVDSVALVKELARKDPCNRVVFCLLGCHWDEEDFISVWNIQFIILKPC